MPEFTVDVPFEIECRECKRALGYAHIHRGGDVFSIERCTCEDEALRQEGRDEQ